MDCQVCGWSAADRRRIRMPNSASCSSAPVNCWTIRPQGVLEVDIEPTPPVKALVVPTDQGLFEAPGTVTPAGRDGPGTGGRHGLADPVRCTGQTALGFDGFGDEVLAVVKFLFSR
ncbi:hypothetical protein HNP00_003302 [Arthrobacter sp. AZCC_0090]|nr:hypothetical protein [Arthrobacter sp. AZCC_0090]